jgi:ABC-2 type transport system permease protein
VTLVLAHTRAIALGLVREPAFLVISLLFPALLFALLGESRVTGSPPTAMASFAAFAFLGVALFDLGGEIAKERESAWESYVRTLPVAPWTRLTARVLAAFGVAAAAAALVVATSLLLTDVALDAGDWLRFAVALVAGAVPVALLGFWIGYSAGSGRTANSIANLLYVILAFAGGLWVAPAELPELVGDLSAVVPTRPWAELVWQPVEGRAWESEEWLKLAGYTVLFGALAVRAYARDQGRRYR